MTQTLKIGIVSRLKHGDLLEAIKKKGWNQTQAAAYLGLDATTFGKIINLKSVPRHFSDELTKKLLDLTGKLPEDLFPEAFRSKDFLDLDKTATVYVDANPAMLGGYQMFQLNPSSDDLIDDKDLKVQIAEVLSTLVPREKKVIEERYLNGKTLDEVGDQFGVTKERVRQIEARALLHLRHPSRSRKLKTFLENLKH